jgi:hypothetical protein
MALAGPPGEVAPVHLNACPFCGAEVAQARVDIGKTHCTAIDCVGEWRRRRIEEKDLALVFVHKQGMQWIQRDDVPKNDMRRAGGL